MPNIEPTFTPPAPSAHNAPYAAAPPASSQTNTAWAKAKDSCKIVGAAHETAARHGVAFGLYSLGSVAKVTGEFAHGRAEVEGGRARFSLAKTLTAVANAGQKTHNWATRRAREIAEKTR